METKASTANIEKPISQWFLISVALFLIYTIAAPVLGFGFWLLEWLNHTGTARVCAVAILKALGCALGVTTLAIVCLGLLNEQTENKKLLGSILITIIVVVISALMYQMH